MTKQIYNSAPGRIKNYLAQENKTDGLLPHSCELRVYKNDLGAFLKTVALGLAGGAGIKVILNDYVTPEAVWDAQDSWCFWVSEDNSDYPKMSELQKNYYDDDLLDHVRSPKIKVADSLEGTFEDGSVSITDSWGVFIDALKSNNVPRVNLDALRAHGTTNSKGLVASGALGSGGDDNDSGSFLSVYRYIAIYLSEPTLKNFLNLLGCLCETIRRGGVYKSAIITTGMRYTHPLIEEYLNVPMFELLGSHQKSIELDSDVLDNKELCQLICDKVNKESLFLSKIQPEGLHQNVCQSLSLGDGATCLIWRVNAGMCMTPEQLIKAYVDAATHLTNLHVNWRNEVGDRSERYLPVEQDRQIAIDVIGLANQLALLGFTYQQFAQALEAVNRGEYENQLMKDNEKFSSVLDLAYAYNEAYFSALDQSDHIMISNGYSPLDRIFCIEPSQRHYLDLEDAEGNTLARSIIAPFARVMGRSSKAIGDQFVSFGNVEIATDVTPSINQYFLEQWQTLMNSTGRAHGISFDLWREIDVNWLHDFLVYSRLKATYYQFASEYDKLSYVNKDVSADFSELEGLDMMVCDMTNKGCSTCGA
jgi:hypothetical protein